MKARLPRLVAITDMAALGASELVARVERLAAACAAGSLAVLLRDHEASARERLEVGRQLRASTRAAEQELWVADRVDLALLLEADGLHLGEASVPAAVARRLLGSERCISRAWHRPAVGPAEVAELQGVDALLLSPIFSARKGRAALGPAALGQLRAGLDSHGLECAVFALGGVTAEHVALSGEATGIAAIGAALGSQAAPLLAALGIAKS